MTRKRSALSQRQIILISGLLLLLAFALRVYRLGYDSIWWDEGYAVWLARMPLQDMIFQTANDNSPPLTYIVLRAWLRLTGESEFALRLPSVYAGLLTVVFGYQIGRELGGRQVGLASAFILSIMRFPVWWSQEIRLYAYGTAITALALWAGLRILTGRQHIWRWTALLTVTLAAGLLSLYLFGAPIIVLNLTFAYAFLVTKRRWRLFAAWAASQIGTLILFAPWWLYATQFIPTWETPQAPVTFFAVIKLFLSVILMGWASNIEQYSAILISGAIILIAATVITFATGSRKSRIGWVMVVSATILSPILIYLLSLPRGQFNYPTPAPRYFLLLSTPVYVLLGWGAVRLNRLWKYSSALVIGALIALSAWTLSIYYPGLRLADDYSSMAVVLETLRGPDDAVVLNNDTDWPIFTYHYTEPFDRHITKTQQIGDIKYADGLLIDYRNHNKGVWLVQTRYADVTDPNRYLWQYLNQHSWDQQQFIFPEGELWFFAVRAERAETSNVGLTVDRAGALIPVEASIAEGVRLEGYTMTVPEVHAGEMLMVGLEWYTGAGITGEWPVALTLLDSRGNEITSSLTSLSAEREGEGRRFTMAEVFVPPNASGGRAQVVFQAGPTWQPLGDIRVRPRRGNTESVALPDSAQSLDVAFGEAITLVAADLPDQTTWAPGDAVPLTLFWRAEQPIPRRYKVFIHIAGEEYNPANNNLIWGQEDKEPQGGAAPTTSWLPGSIIKDDYLVFISPDAPPGTYQIMAGLYWPSDETRLLTQDDTGAPTGDSWTLMEIDIQP